MLPSAAEAVAPVAPNVTQQLLEETRRTSWQNAVNASDSAEVPLIVTTSEIPANRSVLSSVRMVLAAQSQGDAELLRAGGLATCRHFDPVACGNASEVASRITIAFC